MATAALPSAIETELYPTPNCRFADPAVMEHFSGPTKALIILHSALCEACTRRLRGASLAN